MDSPLLYFFTCLIKFEQEIYSLLLCNLFRFCIFNSSEDAINLYEMSGLIKV